MVCKGECSKITASKPSSGGRYDNGQVRCNVCDVYILAKPVMKINGMYYVVHVVNLRCPCCKHRVRQNPRHREQKLNLRKRKEAKT